MVFSGLMGSRGAKKFMVLARFSGASKDFIMLQGRALHSPAIQGFVGSRFRAPAWVILYPDPKLKHPLPAFLSTLNAKTLKSCTPTPNLPPAPKEP